MFSNFTIDNITAIDAWAYCPVYKDILSYRRWMHKTFCTIGLLSYIINIEEYISYRKEIKEYNKTVDKFFAIDREYNEDKSMYKVYTIEDLNNITGTEFVSHHEYRMI